jgi:hypothetical protein
MNLTCCICCGPGSGLPSGPMGLPSGAVAAAEPDAIDIVREAEGLTTAEDI